IPNCRNACTRHFTSRRTLRPCLLIGPCSETAFPLSSFKSSDFSRACKKRDSWSCVGSFPALSAASTSTIFSTTGRSTFACDSTLG
ncbi:hypothetical protein BDZ97DRAFT_1792381, partial [Flammula alnicola]